MNSQKLRIALGGGSVCLYGDEDAEKDPTQWWAIELVARESPEICKSPGERRSAF